MWDTLKYITKITHVKKCPFTGPKYFNIINIVNTKQIYKELKLTSKDLFLDKC